MWDATNMLVQGLMKITDGKLGEESCEGEARVWLFGIAGRALGAEMTR